MDATWISLLPPLIVIAVVCCTRKLNVSLVVGIICAALIATQGRLFSALMLCGQKFVAHISDSDNLYLYCLLIMISSLITLLTVTGSATGCARIIGTKIRTKRNVEMSAIMLSFLLSIDDYLSILTVGFVMRPIADRLAVARTKLAYIVHALAGPLVIIMPLSTWAAAVLAQLDNAGIHLNAPNKIIADPFFVYLKAIPFIFYSMLVVVSVWFIVIAKISYGLIARDEREAVAVDGHAHDEIIEQNEATHSLIELIVPFAVLIGGAVIGILCIGSNHTFVVLCISGLSAFMVSVILSLSKKMISVVQLPAIVYEGTVLMKSSIIMVVCASILGSFLRLELHTGSYVAHLLLGTAPLCLLPLMLFVVSLIITLMTGSAWGTFSLLIPITTQMLIAFLQLEAPVSLDQIPILFPALGAVLSGAACGNHISPFAETTVMTATSTGIGSLEHARTQFGYTIPVIFGTCVSFIFSGLLCDSSLCRNFFVSFGAGMCACIVLLVILNYTKKQG